MTAIQKNGGDDFLKKHEYLEIYPSEVAARKISKHLDKMVTDKPRVYRKTLLRYKKLAQLLLECVAKIVRMLQSEVLLSSGDTEFQELVSDFDTEQIDELRDSVESLGSLLEKKPSNETKKLTTETLRAYRTTFGQAVNQDFGYIEVNECAELLNYWLVRRFSGINPNFKFQIKQLPVWASFIVIAYGKYHALGYTSKFVMDFKSWCDLLDSDDNNCWALPYNVFNMTKVIEPENFTVDAMVIYDILIEGCLSPLIDTAIPMNPSYIVNLLKSYRPDMAYEVRTRFTKQQELIERINLHPTTELAGVDEA